MLSNETPLRVGVRLSGSEGQSSFIQNTSQASTVYQLLFKVLGTQTKLTIILAKQSLYSIGNAA